MVRDAEETVSALIDGELAGIDLERALNTLQGDPELRGRWSRYHLAKDALTNNLTEPVPLFLHDRVMEALRDEPLILAPGKAKAGNRPRPWLKQVAGFAVAATVTAVAILGVQRLGGPDAGPGLVAGQGQDSKNIGGEVVLTARETPIEERQRLEAYIVNHNEYSNSSAMQGVLPYVRLVGHENEQ